MYYYIFVINAMSFIYYGIDKILAILKKRRISEKGLFFLSLIGGALGCLLGMFFFRHKIKKIKFYLWNIVMLLVWGYIMFKYVF